MRNTLLFVVFALLFGCTSPATEQQQAETAALSYIQANYKEVILVNDTANFTPLKKMEGYSEGVKLPVFYRFYYNTAVKDSTGAVSEKQVEVKLDSLLNITEVIIPEEEDNSFQLD